MIHLKNKLFVILLINCSFTSSYARFDFLNTLCAEWNSTTWLAKGAAIIGSILCIYQWNQIRGLKQEVVSNKQDFIIAQEENQYFRNRLSTILFGVENYELLKGHWVKRYSIVASRNRLEVVFGKLERLEEKYPDKYNEMLEYQKDFLRSKCVS